MKANSTRTAARLKRILLYAIPAVDQALQEGKISIESAEVISRYSAPLQELMLAENVPARPKPSDKKVVMLPGLAEKKAADQAARERIEEAMRFEVTKN
jgi:hypothetical protein